MHSNMFIGTGRLVRPDVENGKAWLETDWGSVKITWQTDADYLKSGFDELEEGDTVSVMGRVWMYADRAGEINDATVLVATVEAIKPAMRAKKANKRFIHHTKELDDAIRHGSTYKRYWMEERDKYNKEYERRSAADEKTRIAEQQLALSQDAFREALMTEMVGGDNTDERP